MKLLNIFVAIVGLYLLPDLGHVPSWQDLQVRAQSTGPQCAVIESAVHSTPKQDVTLQCVVLYPSLLGDIGHLALGCGEQ